MSFVNRAHHPLLLCGTRYGTGIVLLLLSLLVLSCGNSKEEKALQASSQSRSRGCPRTIRVGPEGATVRNSLSVYVAGANTAGLSLQWLVNNREIPGATGVVLKYGGLKKHDEVRVRVVTKDGTECLSDPLVIVNTPPKIRSARLLPAIPRKGTDLRVELDAVDIDGDEIYADYEWFINGEPLPEETVGPSPDRLRGDLIERGCKVSVRVTLSDSESTGQSVLLEKLVANSPPRVSRDLVTDFRDFVYTARIKAFDPDGDTLTYSLKEGPEGMTIDPEKGVVTWHVSPEDEGSHDVLVSITDGHGGEILLPFTTVIGFAEGT